MTKIIQTTESPLAAIQRRLNDPNITDAQRAAEIDKLETVMEQLDNSIDPYVDNMTGVEAPGLVTKLDMWIAEQTANHYWKQVHGNQPNPNAEPGEYSCKASQDYYADKRAKMEEAGDTNTKQYEDNCSRETFYQVAEIRAKEKLQDALMEYKRVTGMPFTYKPFTAKARNQSASVTEINQKVNNRQNALAMLA